MESSERGDECQQLESLLVNFVERKQQPNMEEALVNKKKRSVKCNMKKIQSVGYESWAEFSPGVTLFFTLLRYLSILFIVLFINSLPSLIYNYTERGLDIYHENSVSKIKIDIMRFSLANVPIGGFGKEGMLVKQKSGMINSKEIVGHTETSRLVVVLNDLWLTVIVVGFFVYWEIKAKELVSLDTKNVDLPSYRTLVMYDMFDGNQCKQPSIICEKQIQQKVSERGLSNSGTQSPVLSTQEKWQLMIKRHFQKLAPVDSVTIVYDYGETLQQLIDFQLMAKKYVEQSDGKKRVFLYEVLKMKFQMIKKEYLERTKQNMKAYDVPFLPKKAYVTFHSKEDRNRVRNLYKYKINQKELQFSLFSKVQESQTDQIKGKFPLVKKCHTEPISIKWENFHHRQGEEIKSMFMIGGFLCLILFMALIAILLLSMNLAGLVDKTWHLQPQSSQLNNLPTHDPLIQHPTYEQALSTTNVQTLYNFCSSLQLTYSSLRLQYYTLCKEYFANFTEKWLTMWMLSGIIVTINLLLNFIISSLVDYRRHRTNTERSRFLIVNIFLVYLTNMVILLLLIRADFSPSSKEQHSLVHLIKSIFPNLELNHRKIETYPQFNRKWYIHIGNQLMFNYMVSLIICPWLYVVMYWLIDRARLLIARLQIIKFKSQQQLNTFLLPLEFDFQIYYAMALASFYFSLTFAIAMPLFYLLAGISFGSLYLTTRLIFYHFSRVPQPFDHSINTLVGKILLFGVAVHQLVAIFFLYAQDIFPETQNIALQKNVTKSFFQKLYSGWFQICKFTIVMIVYWFKKDIAAIVRKKYFEGKKRRELTEEQILKEVEINTQGLQTGEEMVFQSDEIKMQPIQSCDTSKGLQQLPSLLLQGSTSSQLYSQLLQRYYYRMQDNPLYTNVYYMLTVFHKIVYNSEVVSSLKMEVPSGLKDESIEKQSE